jgi:hypothetical protein
MRYISALVLILGVLVAAFSMPSQAETAGASSGGKRVINITSGSTPGWIPSEDQQRQIVKKSGEYFMALDQGQYDQAYGMLTDGMKQSLPLQSFIAQKKDFYAQSGAAKKRTVTNVNWTKDSPQAPFPGVFAAIDMASRYENIDRHCGFIILYQKPSGGEFEVMREEVNFITNAMAQNIIQKQSQSALDQAWAQMAAHCPNYVPVQ